MVILKKATYQSMLDEIETLRQQSLAKDMRISNMTDEIEKQKTVISQYATEAQKLAHGKLTSKQVLAEYLNGEHHD